MLPKFFGLCFTCESWDTNLGKRVAALPCEASLGAIVCWFFVCGPLRIGGIREKKSTHSIGWEVPVKYLLLTRGRREGVQDIGVHPQPTIYIGPVIFVSEILFVV
jgi:hypothetical protein